MFEGRQQLTRHKHRAAVFVLIGVFAARLLISIQSTGMTSDEFAHIPAGYLHLKEHRFDFNGEHPPLIKELAALPLLDLHPAISEYWKHVQNWKDWFAFCSDFFFLPEDKGRQIVTWARIPMVLVACFLGLLIYRWSSRLFGMAAGLLSLLFFVFEPNMFANSRFVMTDIGASLAYAGFWYSVWCWLKDSSFKNSVLASLAASVSILVKHSMIVVPPCWVCIVLFRTIARKVTVSRGLQTIGVTLVATVLVLNAGYGFHSKIFVASDLKTVGGWFGSSIRNVSILSAVDKWSFLPIPRDYLQGLGTVIEHNKTGHPAYLLGEYSTYGWWWYFPLAFLLKVPLPFLLVSVASFVWFLVASSSDRTTAFCLLFPLVLYATLAMCSHINIGIRHILPIFPFLFVAAGGFFAELYQRRSRFRLAPLMLAVWQAGISLAMSYDPVEYFNVLAGGPKGGWRYLADSNADVGQEFLRVTEYIKTNNIPDPNVYLVGVEYNLLEGINYNAFLPYRLDSEFRSRFPYTYHEVRESFRPGVYLVSVAKILDAFAYTSAATESEKTSAAALRRLLDLQPKAKIGNFVWVYDLSIQDIARSGLSQFEFYYYNGLKYAGPRL